MCGFLFVSMYSFFFFKKVSQVFNSDELIEQIGKDNNNNNVILTKHCSHHQANMLATALPIAIDLNSIRERSRQSTNLNRFELNVLYLYKEDGDIRRQWRRNHRLYLHDLKKKLTLSVIDKDEWDSEINEMDVNVLKSQIKFHERSLDEPVPDVTENAKVCQQQTASYLDAAHKKLHNLINEQEQAERLRELNAARNAEIATRRRSSMRRASQARIEIL